MDDFRRTLNDSQLKAVTTTDGPILVIAGAGSGKTRVIEYRVLNLIRQKISPNSILLLTFTRKAAREMLSRASQHDPRCKNVDGGTFHSFAYRILKKYARSIGFPGAFIVLDESDAEEAVHRCAVIMGLMDGVLPITFSLDNEDEIEEERRLFYVAVTRAKKRCFLTMHHEGFRGGITQFNKISRFVDAPDIISKLEMRDVAGIRSEVPRHKEPSEESQIFDKKNLLEKLMNFYK